jgi:hypothetical protein
MLRRHYAAPHQEGLFFTSVSIGAHSSGLPTGAPPRRVLNPILILPLHFTAAQPKTAPTLCAARCFSTKAAHVSPQAGPLHRHTTVNLRIFDFISMS